MSFMKRILLASTVAMSFAGAASASDLTVGFSQIGSESGWRAAENTVSKSRPRSAASI